MNAAHVFPARVVVGRPEVMDERHQEMAPRTPSTFKAPCWIMWMTSKYILAKHRVVHTPSEARVNMFFLTRLHVSAHRLHIASGDMTV